MTIDHSLVGGAVGL